MKNDIWKIRRILGDKYHLYQEFDGINEKWKLFRKHDGWLTDNSEPIMTSDTHTEKELLKFTKKHREYGVTEFYFMMLPMPFIALALCFINLEFQNEYLRGIIAGMNIYTIFVAGVDMFVTNRNYKVFKLQQKEDILKIKERLEKKYGNLNSQIKNINKKSNDR